MINRETVLVDPSPELLEKLEKFREEHADDPEGNIADRILFEDDRVRIWEMIVEPGGHTALHRHEHDYYMAILSGDLMAGIPPEGPPFIVQIHPDGQTSPRGKGGVEWGYNVGEKTYREILIELKDS